MNSPSKNEAMWYQLPNSQKRTSTVPSPVSLRLAFRLPDGAKRTTSKPVRVSINCLPKSG